MCPPFSLRILVTYIIVLTKIKHILSLMLVFRGILTTSFISATIINQIVN